jgi:hypothetical protein
VIVQSRSACVAARSHTTVATSRIGCNLVRCCYCARIGDGTAAGSRTGKVLPPRRRDDMEMRLFVRICQVDR